MDITASAEGTSHGDAPEGQGTPDQKLVCLASWLERTTLKEAQAAQACSILPATVLTIGTAFAGTFVGIDQRWFAVTIFMVFMAGALSLFLYHYRRWAVWHAVAVRLQNEQKLLIDHGQASSWAKAAKHPPEQLAQWFDRKEPLRPFCGPALALYLAAMVLGMMLLVFAVAKDYEWLQPKSAAAAEAPFSAGSSPSISGRRPVF
jgi:hypothetical protein